MGKVMISGALIQLGMKTVCKYFKTFFLENKKKKDGLNKIFKKLYELKKIIQEIPAIVSYSHIKIRHKWGPKLLFMLDAITQ